MLKFSPLLCLFFLNCTVSKNPLRRETKLLQKGIIKDDTSYVYGLPYQSNSSHLVIQGYFGRYSHKERAALDFKMKRGTKSFGGKGWNCSQGKTRRQQRWVEQEIPALWQQYYNSTRRWFEGWLLAPAIQQCKGSRGRFSKEGAGDSVEWQNWLCCSSSFAFPGVDIQ